MAGVPEILTHFRRAFPGSDAPNVFCAPGRVNLIGEHTDYNLGLVLPMAIQLNCAVACARSGDDKLHVMSEQMPDERVEIFVGNIGDEVCPHGDWCDRIAGVVWALKKRGVKIEGRNIYVSSTVPVGGGLSSSAALGVALTLALGGPRDGLELARIAQSAERDYVGVPCGIMDQFVSANGKKGAALLLDCRSLASREVALPKDVAIVAVNSMVKHELGDSAYRTRVAECAEAARLLKVASLRDAAAADLRKLSGVLLKRARHVVTENARVVEFADAAARGDINRMGRLALESHESLREDYEVSSPELDFLVEAAMAIPGVAGARMTGGGFGGSTVNFVRTGAVAGFNQEIAAKYQEKWGLKPEIHVCEASDGAREIFP